MAIDQAPAEHRPTGSSPTAGEPAPPGAPRLRLLGPIEVLGACGPVDRFRVGQLTRVAAYLALNPGRPRREVEMALWGAGRRGATRHAAISRLRRWLGTDPDGAWYLPRAAGADSRYTLHGDVRSDWDTFRRLIAGGLHTCPTSTLRAALDLVSGPLLAGGVPDDYEWARSARCEMSIAVVAVAIECVRRNLQLGDTNAAAAAIKTAKRAKPDLAAMAELRQPEIAVTHAQGDIVALAALLRAKPVPERVVLQRTPTSGQAN